MTNSTKVFRVGLIADTQYADDEDGTTFDKSSVRRYRQSLRILEDSVKYFQDNLVDYCVQLGDVLDTRTKKLQQESRCLEDIINLTSQSGIPWSFCVGNHDLQSISRERFHNTLIPLHLQDSLHPNRLYYEMTPCDGFRFLFLDGYDISSFSATSDEHTSHARSLLAAKNKNLVRHDGDWFVDLHVNDMKYVPYNGGLGREQLDWIRDVLSGAKANNEKCLIFTHMPIHRECCRPTGLMWNNDELLDLLHAPELQGVAIAVIAGHDHDGGYAIDSHGIHHLIPPAPLECEEGDSAFGHLVLYPHGSTGRVETCDNDNSNNDNEEEIEDNIHRRDGYMELKWVGRLPVNKPENWPTVMHYPDTVLR